MKKQFKSAVLIFLSLIFAAAAAEGQVNKIAPAKDYLKSFIKEFKKPSAEFTTAPFWVWNEIITKEGIDFNLKDYKSKGIEQVILHPRPGLITTYLTDEWFKLVKYAVDKAKSLGMKVWLYDENSYPSGFAGGEVPAQIPETRGVMLQLIKTNDPAGIKQEIAFILKKEGDKFSEVKEIKTGEENYYFVYAPSGKSSWYGGYSYVDIMQRKTTDKFLEVTHDNYKKSIGGEFGKTVSGIFTDEPNIRTAYGSNLICYTPALFDAFKKKWGYELKEKMALLFEETGNWKQVRHNYYSTLLDLMVENWAKPVFEYCEKNNLPMTGHYWEHDWPMPRNVPDNMALASYQQVPGIDLLMNQWSRSPYAQFGNSRFAKEIGSVANQMGRNRTLSETYGASGWDLTFNDMKRIGDWEYALGVNLMNQHLSYYSLTGPRKRDHPLSFSYHTPYWDDYKSLADYYTRLSYSLTRGKQKNDILVLQPTTTGWAYYNLYSSYNGKDPNRGESYFNKMAVSFNDFVNSLEAWQIEYDLGCEDILKKHSCSSAGLLKVGAAEYKLLIIPAYTDNIDSETYKAIESYLASGGKVLSAKVLPSLIDGAESDKVKLLAEKYGGSWIKAEELNKEAITALVPQHTIFKFDSKDNLVFHHRRTLEDCELVFLTNLNENESASGTFTIEGNSVQELDLFTGKSLEYGFTPKDGKVTVNFSLRPAESILLSISKTKGVPPSINKFENRNIVLTEKLKIERNSPNVLTIDYCDLKTGDKTWKDLYFYQAQNETFKAVGMAKSPWDNSVQYKSTVIDNNKFPTGSGFTADYNFTVDAGVDYKGMKLVVERASEYTVSVNGNIIKPEKGKWWLDRGFNVFDISRLVKEGANKITVKAEPMSIYAELEPVYILGNFSIAPQETGFKITPAVNLELGPWNKQGMNLYGDKVSYTRKVNIDTPAGSYFVKAANWKGACLEVYVNKKKAGIISFAPFELDISKYIKTGLNEIKIIAVGTLRNTLGPHHASSNGSCWPSMFQSVQKGFTLAGESYVSNPYGLFEDFEVIQRLKKN